MTAVPRLPLTISEQDFQRTVIDYAILRGWRVMHTRPAQTLHGWRTPVEGHAGFPDLVLAREGVVLIRELKRHGRRGYVSKDQRAWLDALGHWGAIWTPADWETIVEVLR